MGTRALSGDKAHQWDDFTHCLLGSLRGRTVHPARLGVLLPPLGPSPFSGPTEGVAAVLRVLKRGKQPAVAHPDVTGMSAFPTAVMMPLLAALELEGWKFDGLARGRWLESALRAMGDTLGIVEAVKGKSRPLWSAFQRILGEGWS